MIDLADVEAAGIALVGGKAAGLAEMIRAGERVPAGFCITTAAYDIVRAAPGGLPDPVRAEILRATNASGRARWLSVPAPRPRTCRMPASRASTRPC